MIVSLTSGVSAQQAALMDSISQADTSYSTGLSDEQNAHKPSASELRGQLTVLFSLTGLVSLLIGLTPKGGCIGQYANQVFSRGTLKAFRIMRWCGGVLTLIGFLLVPNKASAQSMPKTAEQNMYRLYRNPFELLDKEIFTDYDLDMTELKYPEELIEYMNKFQTFLEFSREENKKRLNSINWDKIKEATYLKAGSPKITKEYDFTMNMSYQEIMNDEYFYTEFLSHGYWPQFFEAFNEYIKNKDLEEKKSLENVKNAFKGMFKMQPPKNTDIGQKISGQLAL
ncbi:MAG: hypothetical protein LBG46_00615 [Elusimicrobiota bacterium]|nr:hypothetical protein [Elusimicrobiota bacterium]